MSLVDSHIKQAIHNSNFHSCLCSNFVDKFYDWKIIVLFYCAHHYLKALAAFRKIDIGNTHIDIAKNVDPKFSNHPKTKHVMRLSKSAWDNYNSLFSYSQTARYEGIIDQDTFDELKKEDYNRCLKHLENFKKYVHDAGVPI